jgi:hypothetical protein
VGVEPTIRLARSRIASFEGREGHRTLFASGMIIRASESEKKDGKLRIQLKTLGNQFLAEATFLRASSRSF